MAASGTAGGADRPVAAYPAMVYPAVVSWADSDDLPAVRSEACRRTEGDMGGHPVHGKAGAPNPLLGVVAANLRGAAGLNHFGADALRTNPDMAVCPGMVRATGDPRNLWNLYGGADLTLPDRVVCLQMDHALADPSHTGVADDLANLRAPAASASIPLKAYPEEVCAPARRPAAGLPSPAPQSARARQLALLSS